MSVEKKPLYQMLSIPIPSPRSPVSPSLVLQIPMGCPSPGLGLAHGFEHILAQTTAACGHLEELRSLLTQSSCEVVSPFPTMLHVLLFFLRCVVPSPSDPDSHWTQGEKRKKQFRAGEMAPRVKVLDAKLHDPGAPKKGENQLQVVFCPPSVCYGKRLYAQARP